MLPPAAARIFMFDAHRPRGTGRGGRVATHARLNAGLFIHAEHEIVGLEGAVVPPPRVQIENATRLDREVRIAWEGPGAMPLDLAISGPFFLETLVGVGCRMMGV